MLKHTVFRSTLIAVIGSLSLSVHAVADEYKQISVPAGDLIAALKALAQQSGVDLVYRSEQLEGLRTQGVAGTLSAQEAVTRLLQGTALTVRVDSSGAILIALPRASSSSLQSPVPATLEGTSMGEATAAGQRALRLAQADTPSSAAAQPSSSRALGAESAAQGSHSAVEEIIVTAQKRTERLIDAPISVGVLTGNDLDRSSSRSVSDALNQVGGVTLIEESPGNTRIAIRGVMPGVGTSTAGYYLDEVPFAFITTSQLPDANAFDLARVEVLRGPQGTLYGVNAMSGVVRVLTNDADVDDFELKARARTSDTENGSTNYGGDLAVNVPLIPGTLAVRAVASYSDLSGYIDSSLDGARGFNDAEAQAYRLKATYTPNEALSVRLAWSRSDLASGGPAFSLDEHLVTQFSSEQDDNRLYDTYNLIAEYRWDNFSLLSSTGYVDYHADNRPEILLGGNDRLNYKNIYDLTSLSQEFRLASQLDGPWQWSAGALYKDTEQEQTQDATPLFPYVYEVRERSQSYAVFAEVTRSFQEDKFAITTGLRYADDRLRSSQQSDFFGGTTDVVPPQRGDFDQTTGRVVLAYKPQRNTTLYGSVSTGFRSGMNQTPAVLLRDSRFGSVDPDSLMNYELGAKGLLFEGAVTYEAAIYYTTWEDVQQSLVLPVGFEARINAGEASGYGFDGSITYSPARALTLQAAVGWSGLEFDADILSRGVVLFAEGERVNRSPEWTGALSGTYRIETPVSGLDVVLSSNLSYRSSTVLRFLSGTVLAQTESDITRNWRAMIGLERERWSVALFGDNILDERGAIESPDPNTGLNSLRQRPRTIGLQATCNF